MAIFGIFFLGISLILYCLYAVVCTWVFRRWMGRLDVPASFEPEWRRERLMTFLIFMSTPMFYIGPFVLLFVYIVGAYRHFRDARKLEAAGIRARLPRIPRVRLEELMVMVFSLGMFPMIVSGFEGRVNNNAAAFIFVLGALLFPLCFLSAYHRLDAHGVPPGKTRMAYLFIYPYICCSIHLMVGGLIALFLGMAVSGTNLGVFLIYIVVAFTPALLGYWLSDKARNEAEAATAKVAAAAAAAQAATMPVENLPPAENQI